jgi:uncharacterized SAM-binding protein YcdF (DUF218 family)
MPFDTSADLSFVKPLITSLALPPALPLGIALLGWLLMARHRQRLGSALVLGSLVMLWVVSCNAFAVWLDHRFLPQTPAIAPQAMAQILSARQVQAVIVLGGGVDLVSREYGQPQPTQATIARMHYGVVLAQSAGLPLGFSGGVGWSASAQSDSEAAGVQRWLAQLKMPALRWAEDTSRDTFENAQFTAALLKKDNIQRIALVTHAWHMPRAQRAFEAAGLVVLPAPMGFTEALYSPILEWIPSAEGLRHSRQVLRELLALAVVR